MKTKFSLLIVIHLVCTVAILAQNSTSELKHREEIYALIENYTKSREMQDTALLNSILTTDIDQLVSSGEWRYGKEGAMKGMMRSSESNPGDRPLKVETI